MTEEAKQQTKREGVVSPPAMNLFTEAMVPFVEMARWFDECLAMTWNYWLPLWDEQIQVLERSALQIDVVNWCVEIMRVQEKPASANAEALPVREANIVLPQSTKED